MMPNLDKSTWQRVKFGDVVKNINDYFSPETDGVLPYVAGPHIDPESMRVRAYGKTSDDNFPPTFKRKFQPGDVLLHSRGIEKIAATDCQGVTGEKLFVLRAIDSDLLDQRFLPILLRSPLAAEYLENHFTGSVNRFLNWKPLAAWEFDLPPLDQQKRIADLLWALEDHAASLRTVMEANGSASSDFFGVSLQESTNRVSIVDRIQSATVGVVVRPTQYYTEEPGGVPALRGLNVGAGSFDLSDLVYFDQASAASLRKSTLQEGDVVVVRTGRPGDAAVVPNHIAGSNCIDLIIVRPGERLNPHFLCRFINSQECKNEIAKLSAGTAQQHFNVGALKLLSVPDSDLDAQDELIQKMESFDEVNAIASDEVVAVDTLRTSLLSSIFGES